MLELNRKRLFLFLILFFSLNISFAPLMALYGLRICPILNLGGFWLGCSYSIVFIAVLLLANLIVLFIKPKFFGIKTGSFAYFFFVYGFATIVGLIAAQVIFGLNHINHLSRAPEVLILASLLLGLTQSYGLSWAREVRTGAVAEGFDEKRKLWVHWRQHILRLMGPLFVGFLVLGHFFLRQANGITDHLVPQAGSADLVGHSLLVLLFLLTWLIVTYGFHFLDESFLVNSMVAHLKVLENFHFESRLSLERSWGLWSELGKNLNQFTQAFGERTRLLKNFSRFVTEGVAKEALHIDLHHKNGVSRDLTVMMSDIRGFTAISEQLSAEQTVLFLNSYFSAMLDVISQYPIVVDKFIGDGILAYVEMEAQKVNQSGQEDVLDHELVHELGQELVHENTIAVEAGLAMLAQLVPLNEKLSALNLPSVSIGVGIFRGPLVVGMIGGALKIQHTIIGDTVNRTARLESLCKELASPLVISESVYISLALALRAKFRDYGEQTLKGVSERVRVFGL